MSQDANKINHLLATLNEQGDERDHTLPDEEELDTIHVYPVEGGGFFLTREPLEPEEATRPVVDSQNDPTSRAATQTPPPFVVFLLLLCVFVLGDLADTQLTALMTPTVTIAITPDVRTITLHSTTTLGKLLAPLTVTESQTVPTTGHGHQDAARATGSLTFYNGSNTAQSIDAGTVFTGSDGIAVVTAEQVTLPAAIAPQFGEATVPAQAQNVGAQGNIQTYDIHIALSSDLTVKNLAPFTNGQDARDYQVVTQADRDTAAATLRAKVTASMTAALQGQLMPGEQLQSTPCTPSVTANHTIGDEAETLQVTVSDSCTAIVYNAQELTAQATRLLTIQATKTVGQGYSVSGNVQVTVTKATTPSKTVVFLSFTTQGTYIYQLSTKTLLRLKNLVVGKPRETALRQLATLPGIQHVSISGIPDNQLIPDDLTHIHLLIIVEGERTWAIQP